ncbi:MAG: murein L,D-transpeptidase catalytic domain-containing protein, partial [Deltaproteobacteria bacterium]
SGHNGYSLRLQGLDAGFNDRASERAIVIHGAWYVSPQMAATQGRIGRSWGCPAVRPSIARQLIDAIRDGSLVVAYYPDETWLNRSAFVGDCAGGNLANGSTQDTARPTPPAATVASTARSP